MPTRQVRVTIGRSEILMNVTVPEGSAERVRNFLTEYFSGMRGVTSWREGLATDAANRDASALQAFFRSRRQAGIGARQDVLVTRPVRRQKRQKYPRRP